MMMFGQWKRTKWYRTDRQSVATELTLEASLSTALEGQAYGQLAVVFVVLVRLLLLWWQWSVPN